MFGRFWASTFVLFKRTRANAEKPEKRVGQSIFQRLSNMKTSSAPAKLTWMYILLPALILGCQPADLTKPDPQYTLYKQLPADVVDLIKRVDAARPINALPAPTKDEAADPKRYFERVNTLKVKGATPLKLMPSNTNGGKVSNKQEPPVGSLMQSVYKTPSAILNPPQPLNTEYEDDPVTRSYYFSGWSGVVYGEIRVDVTTDGIGGRVTTSTVTTMINYLFGPSFPFGSYTQTTQNTTVYRPSSGNVNYITFDANGVYSIAASPLSSRWRFEGYLQVPVYGGSTFGGGGGGNAMQLMGNASLRPWEK